MPSKSTKLSRRQAAFAAAQHVFFVATAGAAGRVNLSPKGADTLRVLEPDRIVWLSLSGSGNETAAHVRETGRMTLMFCSFDGDAQIVRVYGSARVVYPRDPDWPALSALFDGFPGARQVFDLRVDLVQTSCGTGVPVMRFERERAGDELLPFYDELGPAGVEAYWRRKTRSASMAGGRELIMIERGTAGGGPRLGAAMVLGSAVLFASAGLFAKSVQTDAWTVLFWRGLFAALFLYGLLAPIGRVRAAIWKMDRVGWAVAVISTVASAAFIAAFKNTTVTNVTLIYAVSPFVAAALAWLWIRERPDDTCLIAAGVSVIGVFITVGGFWTSPAAGDLLAMVMTVLMSSVVVIYRVFPGTDTIAPMIMSSVLMLPLALPFTDPFAVTTWDLFLLFGFGLTFAVASVALLAGAKRLPSSEAALLSISETPLAPVLAWFIIAERPGTESLLGGVVIMAAVLWHMGAARRRTASA